MTQCLCQEIVQIRKIAHSRIWQHRLLVTSSLKQQLVTAQSYPTRLPLNASCHTLSQKQGPLKYSPSVSNQIRPLLWSWDSFPLYKYKKQLEILITDLLSTTGNMCVCHYRSHDCVMVCSCSTVAGSWLCYSAIIQADKITHNSKSSEC